MRKLTDFSPSDLVTAIETGFFRGWTPFGRLPEAHLYNDSAMLWFTTGIQDSLLNAILSAQIKASEVEAKIKAVIAYFHARSLPLSWYTGPSTRPHDLGQFLQAYGFNLADDSVGMAVDLLKLPAKLTEIPDVSVKKTATIQEFGMWIKVFKEGFHVSAAFIDAYIRVCTELSKHEVQDYYYLGFLNGHPVASLTLSLDQGIANIYDVATIPEFRRRGIGTTLTLTALLDARTLGYRVGVLQATAAGVEVYRRIGFLKFCQFERYVFAT